jgi:hypothetical protein
MKIFGLRSSIIALPANESLAAAAGNLTIENEERSAA